MTRPYRAGTTKPGKHRCAECGRDGLHASAHKSKAVAFHFAPAPCQLPCIGGQMPPRLDSEDLADGMHSANDCPHCAPSSTPQTSWVKAPRLSGHIRHRRPRLMAGYAARPCDRCLRPFSLTKPNRRFCSDSCRVLACYARIGRGRKPKSKPIPIPSRRQRIQAAIEALREAGA